MLEACPRPVRDHTVNKIPGLPVVAGLHACREAGGVCRAARVGTVISLTAASADTIRKIAVTTNGSAGHIKTGSADVAADVPALPLRVWNRRRSRRRFHGQSHIGR